MANIHFLANNFCRSTKRFGGKLIAKRPKNRLSGFYKELRRKS